MEKKFYHTQESRDHRLANPIPCTRDDEWLGNAIYYWYEEVDADSWGNTSKRTTGYYEVYISDIDCENHPNYHRKTAPLL